MDNYIEELDYTGQLSPSLYEGITIIEPMVRYHLYPTKENRDVLFYWYLSSLQNYWIKCKQTLSSPSEEEKELSADNTYNVVENHLGQRTLAISRYSGVNLDAHEELFKLETEERVERLRERIPTIKKIYDSFLSRIKSFSDSKELPTKDIICAYYLLAMGFCLDPILLFPEDQLRDVINKMIFYDNPKRLNASGMEKIYIKDIKNIQLLCNDTGVFAIGSYLIAYGNGVDLIGIPVQISSYDEITNCSAEFFTHDVVHLNTMKHLRDYSGNYYKGSEANENVRKQNLHVLKDDTLPPAIKELILLGLWYSFHEQDRLVSQKDGPFSKFAKKQTLDLGSYRRTPLYDDFQTPYYTEGADLYITKIKKHDTESYRLIENISSGISLKESMALPVIIHTYYCFSSIFGLEEIV